MPAFEFTHDLFVSYAHADDIALTNQLPWIELLVESIRHRHQRDFLPAPLDIFVDKHAIRTMTMWETLIRDALRTSRVMLAILSPGYFASEYCRKEWQLYIDREIERGLAGRMIAPIYVVDVPGFDSSEEGQFDCWRRDLKARQYVDVRPWWGHGEEFLRVAEVQRRMQKLDVDLAEAVALSDRVAGSPSDIPAHNRYFSGREREITTIRETFATHRLCVIQGIGGMGKSALAFEYAHNFPDEYPGGRFLVNATAQESLDSCLLQLVEPLGIGATGGSNEDAQVRRVRETLRSGPRRLIVIDNVEDANLLSRSSIARSLPASDMLHVLVTTRLQRDESAEEPRMALDVVSVEDGTLLLEKYRPAGTDEDRVAQARIAALLGGFPLVLEVAAVFLWQNPDVSYEGFRQRLETYGPGTINDLGETGQIHLSRHGEAVISKVLAPTLDSLLPAERLVLQYAVSLPAECLPWGLLRALAAHHDPALAHTPGPGFPDPWVRTRRRLLGLRLLNEASESRIARIHPIVQSVVRSTMTAEQRRSQKQETYDLLRERARALSLEWHKKETRWEVDTLFPICLHAAANGDLEFAVELAVEMAEAWAWLDRRVAAIELDERLLAGLAGAENGDSVATARLEIELAGLLRERVPERARSLSASALHRIAGLDGVDPLSLARITQIFALIHGRDFGDTRARLTTAAEHARAAGPCGAVLLVAILNGLGRTESSAPARRFYQEALDVARNRLAPDHPAIAVCLANLAEAEAELGHGVEARRLIDRALEIDRASLDPGHMHLSIHLSNLATIESRRGDHAAAIDAAREALEVSQQGNAGPLDVAYYHQKLGVCEQEFGAYRDAKEHYLETVRIRANVEGDDQHGLPDTFARLGAVCDHLGERGEAASWYQRARDLGVRFGAFEIALTLYCNWQVARHLGAWEGEKVGSGDEPDSPEVFVSCAAEDDWLAEALIPDLRSRLGPFGMTVDGSRPFPGLADDENVTLAFSRRLRNTSAGIVIVTSTYLRERQAVQELAQLFLRLVAEMTSPPGWESEPRRPVPAPTLIFIDGESDAGWNATYLRGRAREELLEVLGTDTLGSFETLLMFPAWTVDTSNASTEETAATLARLLLQQTIGDAPAESPPTVVMIWDAIWPLHFVKPEVDLSALTSYLEARVLNIGSRSEAIAERWVHDREWCALFRAIAGGFQVSSAFHRREEKRPPNDVVGTIMNSNEALRDATDNAAPLGTLVNLAYNGRIVSELQRAYYSYVSRFGRDLRVEVAVLSACWISLEMYDAPPRDLDGFLRLLVDPLLAGTRIEDGFPC